MVVSLVVSHGGMWDLQKRYGSRSVQVGPCYSVGLGLLNPLILLANSRVLKGGHQKWKDTGKNRGLLSSTRGLVPTPLQAFNHGLFGGAACGHQGGRTGA